jgi:signal transduction histidine kinase/ligand-binding sensor domain-containing protein
MDPMRPEPRGVPGPVALVIALILAASTAGGQEAASRLEEAWRWRVFDRSEGLSSTFVSAVHQDRYEFIYAATEKGVCRYDLWEWTVLENGDPFNDGEVLRFVESSGEIYAVTRNALWKVQGGTRLDLFYRGGGLHAASSRLGEVYAIEEREARHFQVRGETTERMDPEVRLPPGRVLDYEIDAEDIHWLATSEGLFFRDLSRRAWRAVEDRDLDPPLQGLRCTRFFRISGRGAQRPLEPRGKADDLWALFQGARPQGARATAAGLDGGSWKALGAPDGPPLARILMSHDRVLHGTTEDGSLHLSIDGKSWARVESPGVGKVALQAGIVDSAGMLWFRQGTGGLASFDGQSRRWESIPSGAGGSFPNVLSVIETDEGEVWMGMTSGVSRSRPGVAPEFFAEVQGVALEKVTGLAEDSLRRVWVSSAESFPGALCFDGTGWVKESVPGFSDHPIRRIVKDHSGEIWFLSQGKGPDGTYLCYRSSVYTSYELETVRLGHGPINDLVRSRDEEDSFWIATDEGLVAAVLEGGSFRVERRYTDQDGLRSIRVWSVAMGHDGAVWISYPGGGVTRLKDGAPASFDESNGLMSSEVWSIVLAGQSLWFGTDRGLSRFEGDCWYGYSIESAVPRACCRVWPLAVSRIETDSVIAGTFGLGAVRLRLDDRRRPRFLKGELPARVAEGAAATFRWDARDYRNQTPPPALLSRSRIDGGPWTAFSSARSRDVKDLPLGRHTLEVEVRDLDGNRTRDPFVHDFEVGGEADDRSFWTVLIAGGALLLASAGWRLALRWAAEGRRRTRHRSFFADHPRPVILFGPDGRVLDWNGAHPEWIGLGGVRRDDLLGRPLDLLPFASTVAFRAALKGLLEGRPFHLPEHRMADAAGAPRILDVTGFPLHAGAGMDGAVVIFDDRTREVEERRLGERDRRLASLRTLAGRIAPSFGSLLEECLGDQGVRANAPLARRLREAESVARRLSTFAGPEGEVSRSATFSVKGLLDRLAGAPPLPRGGTVKVDLQRPEDLRDATGDERLLEEVFLEILKNAADAMGGKGTVALRARNLRIDDDPGTLAAGDYVEVTVADTGAGIHAADLDLLFEPFYSTKPRDRALGIGLSLALGIVRTAGGDIRVASSPGAGTTVTVLLAAAGASLL